MCPFSFVLFLILASAFHTNCVKVKSKEHHSDEEIKIPLLESSMPGQHKQSIQSSRVFKVETTRSPIYSPRLSSCNTEKKKKRTKDSEARVL